MRDKIVKKNSKQEKKLLIVYILAMKKIFIKVIIFEYRKFIEVFYALYLVKKIDWN